MKETFYKHKGDVKGTEVEIKSQKYLSEGGRGVAFQVEVKIGSKDRIFVTKKFSQEKEIERALRNYQEAKQSGLKVFTTYRIDQTGKRILMTSGHTKDDVCLGSVNEGRSLQYYNLPKIKSITNLNEFMQKYFEQAKIAANSRIHIMHDVPFFFVKRGEENSPLDFVLGDTDTVYKRKERSWLDYQKLLQMNISELFW
ncbi:MAG: hypothetical protein HY226_00915 [Candidatus Vogelbacteria bacterium]|nr:hypothetical protein [Candidatus Vogelbacteria bacterium]